MRFRTEAHVVLVTRGDAYARQICQQRRRHAGHTIVSVGGAADVALANGARGHP
jgi:hypothetical protein